MNIQAQSSVAFGDLDGLQDFMFVHRLAHDELDRAIERTGKGAMPSYALDDPSALLVWQALTQQLDVPEDKSQVFTNWLELHATLHRAEYAALGLKSDVPDLTRVDFRNREQFYDWMAVHSAVHDALNQAVGVV